jgi:hypothetical protein
VLPPALRQLRAWQWAQLSARLDADCDGVLVRQAFPFLCGPFSLRFTYAAPILVTKS